eukprot:GHUV01029511.1.p1 GENE.GHUV01029511.1~~GHUV01029511.1.p1  ORF type:complete len:101 (-),score=35.43 GHUV01029511.1:138-440(-)
MQEQETAGNQVPKTIGGYLMTKVNAAAGDASDATIKPADYLIRCADYNTHVPRNMWLACGDTNLDLLAPRLSTMAGFAANAMGNAFKNVHYYLKNFIELN